MSVGTHHVEGFKSTVSPADLARQIKKWLGQFTDPVTAIHYSNALSEHRAEYTAIVEVFIFGDSE